MLPRRLSWIEAGGAAAAFLGSTLLAVPAGATWKSHGASVAALSTADHPFSIAKDGAGGAFVFWHSFAPHEDRIHHVDATGSTATGWPSSGIPVVDGVSLVADDSGGLFVVFAVNDVLHVVRWTQDGDVAPGWTAAGVPLGSNATYGEVFAESDGAGGIIVAWPGRVSGTVPPRLARVAPGGQIVSGWPTAGLAPNIALHEIEPDGAGGCYAATSIALHRFGPDGAVAAGWPLAVTSVGLSSTGSGGICFIAGNSLHRREASGDVAVGWPQNGVFLSSSPGRVFTAVDASGGVYVTFSGTLDGAATIFLTYVAADATIAPAWGNGIPIGGYDLVYSRPVVVDDAGNAVVVSGVRAQRVASDATVLTSAHPGGFALAGHVPYDEPHVVSSMGDVIVAWSDGRNGNSDVFVASVDRAQAFYEGWPANGFDVGSLTGVQSSPAFTVDAAGNAVLAWVDAGATRVRAARTLDIGRADSRWPATGTGVATATFGEQHAPAVAASAGGGAFIVFEDSRNSLTETDLWVQRLTEEGQPAANWPEAGLALSSAPRVQRSPVVLANSSGILVAFEDFRSGSLGEADIAIQSMTAAGATSPLPDGIVICSAGGTQTNPRIVSDAGDGAFVAWNDARGADADLYVFRMTATALPAPGWSMNGRPVCTASGDQAAIEIAADGSGGFVAVWEDRRTGDSDIRACRFDAEAMPVAGWPAEGLIVCGAAGDQTRPQLVADGNAIQFCWEDRRDGDADIGLQRLAPNGTTAAG